MWFPSMGNINLSGTLKLALIMALVFHHHSPHDLVVVEDGEISSFIICKNYLKSIATMMAHFAGNKLSEFVLNSSGQLKITFS